MGLTHSRDQDTNTTIGRMQKSPLKDHRGYNLYKTPFLCLPGREVLGWGQKSLDTWDPLLYVLVSPRNTHELLIDPFMLLYKSLVKLWSLCQLQWHASGRVIGAYYLKVHRWASKRCEAQIPVLWEDFHHVERLYTDWSCIITELRDSWGEYSRHFGPCSDVLWG